MASLVFVNVSNWFFPSIVLSLLFLYIRDILHVIVYLNRFGLKKRKNCNAQHSSFLRVWIYSDRLILKSTVFHLHFFLHVSVIL